MSLHLAEKVRQRAHQTYVSNPPEYCLPDGRSMVVDTTSVRMRDEEPAFTFVVRDIPPSLQGFERFEGVRFYVRRSDDRSDDT